MAYLVAADAERPHSDELAEFLGGSLPDYMVPSSFVWLDQLPLTEHGKIDRDALPAPAERGRGRAAERGVRGTRVEAATASVVAELLDIEEIGMNQNFFLLGGHSMLGAQLIVRLEDMFGVEISLRYLFDHPTPAEIAAEVERQMAAGQLRRLGDRREQRPDARARGSAPQPLSPPRPGGAGQSLPAVPPAARGGSGALGSVPARVGRHPLRGRGHGAAPLPRRPDAVAGAPGGARHGRADPDRRADGATDAVPRSARSTAACAAWRRRPSRRAASQCLREHIRQIAERLVDELAGEGRFDVMDGLANPLPAIVTAEMLGVPTADHELLKSWSQDFAEMLGNFQHNPGRAKKVLPDRRGDGRLLPRRRDQRGIEADARA